MFTFLTTLSIVLAQSCSTALLSGEYQICSSGCSTMANTCSAAQCLITCAQNDPQSTNQALCVQSAQSNCLNQGSSCNCDGVNGASNNGGNNNNPYATAYNANTIKYTNQGYNTYYQGPYCEYPPCTTTVSTTLIAEAAGGTAGGVVLLIAVIVLAICLVRRRRRVVKDMPVVADVSKVNVAENNPLFEQSGMSKDNPIFYETQSSLMAPSSSPPPPPPPVFGMPPPPASDYGTQSNFNTVDFAKQDPKAALYPNLSEQALPVLQSRPSQVGRINDERMLSTRFDSPPLYGDEQAQPEGLYPGVGKI